MTANYLVCNIEVTIKEINTQIILFLSHLFVILRPEKYLTVM